MQNQNTCPQTGVSLSLGDRVAGDPKPRAPSHSARCLLCLGVSPTTCVLDSGLRGFHSRKEISGP